MTLVFKTPCCGETAELHDAEQTPDLPGATWFDCPHCKGVSFIGCKFASEPLDVRFFEVTKNAKADEIMAAARAKRAKA